MTRVLDLSTVTSFDELHATIDNYRSSSIAARLPDGAHVFFNQEDAAFVMRCHDFRFSFVQIDPTTSPYLTKAIEHELLNMHGDAHTRMRTLISAALRDRVVDDLRDQIRTVVDTLIEAMPADGVVDLTADFADPLPGRILGPMYGVPYEDTDGLNEWIAIGGRKLDALQSGVDIELVENANRRLHDYLRELLADRRNDLGSDIFSELILTEVDGDRLSEDELVYLAGELAAAGVDTTRAQLPLILVSLLQHPDQLAALLADPTLAMAAVDEGMRFAPLPWLIPHAAVHDVEYKGIEFAEGDIASILIPAVNRDPSAMPDPHVFDIARPRTRNFSFGHGAHACPAAQLARVEMAIAIEQLATRLSSISLAEEPTRSPQQSGRTLDSLHVQISKS